MGLEHIRNCVVRNLGDIVDVSGICKVTGVKYSVILPTEEFEDWVYEGRFPKSVSNPKDVTFLRKGIIR